LHFCCLGFESGFSGIYCTMIWTMSIAFLLSLILSHEIEPCSRFSSPKILFFYAYKCADGTGPPFVMWWPLIV
jgi:hypothetical protein